MKKLQNISPNSQLASQGDERSSLASWRISRRALLAALGTPLLAAALPDSALAALPAPKKSTVEAADAPIGSVVKNAVPHGAALFALRDVRILGGPVGAGQEMNRRYLRTIEPDRLLSWFRHNGAGLDPISPPYRGWESESPLLPGHICGFFLSGASMMVQATGDPLLREKIDYIVDQLAAVQTANGNGYALAVPDGKAVFAEIAQGHIVIGGLPWTGYQINGHFEPTYTLNKIMLGLYQAHLATNSAQSREVLIRLADWFGDSILEKLDDAQVQTLLDCEHGSINESFAQVYMLTGDKKYLTWARRLCHERMLAPLAAGDGDFLTNYHANTQIPKFTGFEHLYALNGEPKLDHAAVNFWNDVVDRRSWVIGGNSADEHFFDPKNFDQAIHSVAGPESCNTVNMLRLTEALYPVHPSGRLMDYYERALFNHLLAVHDPERGMFVYYTTMQPGGYRVYSDEFDSMWCCVGTGLEAPGKYGQMIYTHASDDSALDVNLFIPSSLNWASKGVQVHQTTEFPQEAATTLQFTCHHHPNTAFALRVRHPWWVRDGELTLTVNGKPVTQSSVRGEYAEVVRTWRSGDIVHVNLPMRVTAETLPGDDGYAALLYGPIVLSQALGRAGLIKADFWALSNSHAGIPNPDSDLPTFVAETPQEVAANVQPVDGEILRFRATGLAGSQTATLLPFYENHFQRYAVYWPRLTAAQFQQAQARQAEAAIAQKALDARTVDRVLIGDDASETAHHLDGLRSESGLGAYGQFMDRHWRDAHDGGWFAFDLKVPPTGPVVLHCTFWGQEQGARTFDVIVEDRTISTITLGDTGVAQFIDKDLPLPDDLMRGKSSITVKFQAHSGCSAGGLFDLRTLLSQS